MALRCTSQYTAMSLLEQPSEAHPSRRSKHLELPTPSGISRPHLTQTPSHLLPATALFRGPHSRNASHTSLHRQALDRENLNHHRNAPIEAKPQHLPRAHPPTTSFSGPRPSLIGQLTNAPAQIVRPGQAKKEDEFRADAVWAEMQKTLADVELSAMNSSHVFSNTHVKALEDLRSAQLGLAQAWAKSEADEMADEEFGNDTQEQSAVGTFGRGGFASPPSSPVHHPPHPPHKRPGPRSRGNSASSAAGGNLEEETERDIRLARRRREANDRYFRQVNKGVLDVVKKLDEVAGAMRRVEKESREIWNSSSGEEDDLGDVTDSPVQQLGAISDTDVLTDSPDSKKR